MKTGNNDNRAGERQGQALVVGNHYAHFGEKHARVFTFAAFHARHSGGDIPFEAVHLGQGLSDREREAVARLCGEAGCRVPDLPTLATSRLSHKHVLGNTMVSMPRRCCAREYELDLLICSKAAEISDHQTGEHLSGASLEEAARQALLVVTEYYSIPEGASCDYYFVTRAKEVEFLRFAFPLPTVVRYEELASEADAERNVLSFDVRVTFEQAGRPVAAMRFAFAVYRKGWLAAKEHSLAAESVERLLGWSPSPTLGAGVGKAAPLAVVAVGVGARESEGDLR